MKYEFMCLCACVLKKIKDFYVYVCVCTSGYRAQKFQKRVSEPMEQELQIFVSYEVGDEDQIQFLCKSNKYS